MSMVQQIKQEIDPNIRTEESYENPFISTVECHPIWESKFLINILNGRFGISDYRLIFSQYQFYNKRFLQLLSILMSKCRDSNQIKLILQNVYEELGEGDDDQNHATIYKNFLTEALSIGDLEKITEIDASNKFVDDYMNLCIRSSVGECASILAFATEGIVSRMYKIFKTGLMKAGLDETDLDFFTLHIECDDGHAEDLEKVAKIHINNKSSEQRCLDAVTHALNIRNTYFESLNNIITGAGK